VPSASPSAAAASFRDDFDGPLLDQDKWASYPQSGIIRFEGGKLDLLNTPNQKNFPYLLARHAVIPATGPFFLETSYTLVSAGAAVSFCLDYLPAEAPNEAPLTRPFMSTSWFYHALKFAFETETGTQTFAGTDGATIGSTHRIRVENDGNTTYRVIFDTTELGTFQSKRRPTRFWIGANPVADLKGGTTWPRLQIDYVAAGVLGAPDPATPAASPDAAASAP
jgi:hypothetical protein